MEGFTVQEPGMGGKAKVLFLSVACTTSRRIKRRRAPLTPESESLHPPTTDLHWSESFYFNFGDPKRSIGGWTRIGILPNQESDLGTMMIYAGGSRVLTTLQSGRATMDEEGISLEALDYQRLEPLRSWRLTFQGQMADVDDSRKLPELDLDNLRLQRVEVNLVFVGMAPCFDFREAHPRATAEMLVGAGTRLRDLRWVPRISSEHYAQAGNISGTISIGNREITLQGSGHRDHSWGPRNRASPHNWTWLTCQFGDDLAFNLSRVNIASVDILDGFVTRDGNNYALRRAYMETEFEDDGVTPSSLEFRMEDVGGRTIEVSGEPLAIAPIFLESRGHRTLINEALTEYHLEDQTGYGISEYFHQLD